MNAGDLEIGDEVVSLDGNGTVESIAVVDLTRSRCTTQRSMKRTPSSSATAIGWCIIAKQL
ncbi:MAG: hypothetical protein IPK52_20615 [Chloroflexi bacterium]|nr:hypothetical protein [Chloroflexota bacterium]